MNKQNKKLELECFVDVNKYKPIHQFHMSAHGHLFVSGDLAYSGDYVLKHMINDAISKHNAQEMKIIMFSQSMDQDTFPKFKKYLKTPIINTTEDLFNQLTLLKKMMLNRYKTFRNFKAKDIYAFNGKILNLEIKKRYLPYVLLIIHEMPHALDPINDPINILIHEITLQSRAASIHVILSTTSAIKSMSPVLKYHMDGIIFKIDSQESDLVLVEKRKEHKPSELDNNEAMIYDNIGSNAVYKLTNLEKEQYSIDKNSAK